MTSSAITLYGQCCKGEENRKSKITASTADYCPMH